MFVCICNAITDHDIKETIAAGATHHERFTGSIRRGDLLRLLRRIGSVILTASSAQNTVTAGINVQS